MTTQKTPNGKSKQFCDLFNPFRRPKKVSPKPSLDSTSPLLAKKTMEYKNLGSTGLKVSVLGFGTGILNGDKAEQENFKQIVKKAYDAGINFFDTAEMYGYGKSEIALGKAIKELQLPREQLVISTKIFWGPGDGPNVVGLSHKHIIEGTRNSLKRLQLEYVDIIFCHKPDFETPVEETCKAFDYLINQGKTFYWGTSDWPVERIMEAHRVCEELGLHKPVVEQPEYNMLTRTKVDGEYLPLFQDHGMGTTVWSPLASGVLSGKYNKGIPKGTRFDSSDPTMKMLYENYLGENVREKTMKVLKELEGFAKELGCTQAQLAYAWVLKNHNVSVCLLGATKVTQIEENLKALEVAKKLTPEILERIGKVLDNTPQGHFNFKLWKPFKKS